MKELENTGSGSEERKVRTYDIINAGPRNRFECQGVIVSNSGAGIQTQNLPRGKFDGDYPEEMLEACEDILNMNLIELIKKYENFTGKAGKTVSLTPLDVISSCVRGMICAEKGKVVIAADYSNIEGRMTAWCAREDWKIEAFREYDAGTGPDLYKLAYSKAFTVPVKEVTKPQRQVGKVMELSCISGNAYILVKHPENNKECVKQLNNLSEHELVWDGEEFVSHEGLLWKGLQRVINVSGVELTPDHLVMYGDKWTEARDCTLYGVSENAPPFFTIVYDIANCGPRNQFKVWPSAGSVNGLIVHNCGFGGSKGAFAKMAEGYGAKFTEAEALANVKAWREAHPNIVRMWYAVSEAAMSAFIQAGTVVYTEDDRGRVSFFYDKENDFLHMNLPSGRALKYFEPRIQTKINPWTGREQNCLTAMGTDSFTKKWLRYELNHLILTENLVQALARDKMMEGMLKAETKGYKIIMTIHDELVAEVPEGFGSVEEFENILCELDPWAEGLPVSAEGFIGYRYRK